MTQSPQRQSRPRWRILRAVLLVGALLTGASAIGAWWLWRYVQQNLAPQVAAQVGDLLQRPIHLGAVESMSLTGLRFGPSVVPPTETDPDTATVKAVEVGFNPLTLLGRRLDLDITLVEPSLYVEQNERGEWLNTALKFGPPGALKITVDRFRVRDGKVIALPLGPQGDRLPRLTLNHVQGQLVVRDNGQDLRYQGQGVLGGTKAPVKLEGSSQLAARQIKLNLKGEDLSLKDLSQLAGRYLALPVAIAQGRVNADLAVDFVPGQTPSIDGAIQFQDVAAQVPQLPQSITQAQGSLQLQGKTVRVTQASGRYGPLATDLRGTIALDGPLNLQGTLKPVAIPAALTSLAIKTPVPVSGEAQGDWAVTGTAKQPLVQGTLRTTKPLVVDKVQFNQAETQFKLQQQTLSLNGLRAVPASGGLITGTGQVLLGPQGGISLDAEAVGLSGDRLGKLYGFDNPALRLGLLKAQARIFGPLTQPRTTVRFRALEGSYPAQGELVVQGSQVRLNQLEARVAGGIVRASGQRLGDRWVADADLSGIQLGRLSPQLRGTLTGVALLSGPLKGLSAQAVSAQGSASFSRGVSLVDSPLAARWRWDGRQVIVEEATAQGLRARGTIQANLSGTPRITGLNLGVQARDFRLTDLPLSQLPQAVQVRGVADFSGQITGTPEAPQVLGALALRQFGVNQLPFEPRLRGTVRVDGRGTHLALTGQRDEISLVLDQAFQPQRFRLRQGDALAEGVRQGADGFRVDLSQFELASLGLKPLMTLPNQPLQGIASGRVDVNLKTLAAAGNLTIANPAIGQIKGDRLAANFRYANGTADILEGELVQGNSRYQLTGQTRLNTADPEFRGQVAIAQADPQDLLRMLQWFDLNDVGRGLQPPTYAKAEALRATAVGLPEAKLLTQIRRLSEIKTLVAQEAQRQRSARRIPPLSELVGRFDGKIQLAGSLQKGLKADFEVSGTSWTWGDYQADRISVQGEWAEGRLTLLPVKIQSGEAIASFSGQLGGPQQSGQLQVEKVPVETLRSFIDLPVDLTGQMDLLATLAGSTDNPQIIGDLKLTNGTLNQTPIQTRQTGFNYSNARLNFGGLLETNGPEPIRLAGSIPYKLPFSRLSPDSNQISLRVDVRNEGLAFLNLLTRDQLRWQAGEGQVRLEVGGTLEKPIATGLASFKDATLAAQVFPEEPLSQVNGTLQFNRDRIVVSGIQGTFSKGLVQAQGIIPLAEELVTTDPDHSTPLQVQFRNLELNLRGRYRGGASGDVLVQGTALAPELAGQVRLDNGQILLPDGGAASGANGSGATGTPSPVAPAPRSTPTPLAIASPVFNNLRLNLGDRVRIATEPLFSFQAQGMLAVNGSLANPLPEGEIALTQGRVSLFTTTFSLSRRSRNVALFTPENGLNPNLKLQLVAAATEVNRRQSLFANTTSAEVIDLNPNDLGSIQTIRVRADVDGPADRLLDSIRLSSSPGRSQAEIVSLIGGGFVDTLGRGGDSTLALANLAGSAVLGNIQSLINNSIGGPVELRLFPVIVDAQERRNQAASGDDKRNSVFALGGEVGVNITNNFSFSALRLLTVDVPTQYNLRYQLSDSLTLRATSDFRGENRAVLDYESRF